MLSEMIHIMQMCQYNIGVRSFISRSGQRRTDKGGGSAEALGAVKLLCRMKNFYVFIQFQNKQNMRVYDFEAGGEIDKVILFHDHLGPSQCQGSSVGSPIGVWGGAPAAFHKT